MQATHPDPGSAATRAAAPLVTARGLGVRRGGRWLVRGIDLEVARGEVVTLIGPNGGGKSTIVKAMIGLIDPDEGTVERATGLTIGYVPQKFVLDWSLPLTVRRLMRLTAPLGAGEITDALAEVNAAHLVDRLATDLSGGEMQRVLLARAIARRPDVLVLDEPVQGVDYVGEIALYDLIDGARARLDAGVLLVSHDLHVVMAKTDRVVCVNGHVCCSGTPDTVIADAEYRRLFGPRAAGALAVYRHHHDHDHGLAAHAPHGGAKPDDS